MGKAARRVRRSAAVRRARPYPRRRKSGTTAMLPRYAESCRAAPLSSCGPALRLPGAVALISAMYEDVHSVAQHIAAGQKMAQRYSRVCANVSDHGVHCKPGQDSVVGQQRSAPTLDTSSIHRGVPNLLTIQEWMISYVMSTNEKKSG